MIGRRIPDNVRAIFQPGDYQKVVRDGYVEWFIRPPVGGLVSSGSDRENRIIVEHEDGTITVTPSIRMIGIPSWYGRLTRGVWVADD